MRSFATMRRIRGWLSIIGLMLIASPVGVQMERRAGDVIRRAVPESPARRAVVVVDLPAQYAFMLPPQTYRTVMTNLAQSGVAAVAWEYYFGAVPDGVGAPADVEPAHAGSGRAETRGGPFVVHRVCHAGDRVLLPQGDALADADVLGTMQVARDPDQVVRGIPESVGRFPPVGIAAADLVLRGRDPVTPPPTESVGSRRIIDPRHERQLVHRDCFEDLLKGPCSELRDAIVFIGVCAPAEAIRYPLSDGRLVPATVLQAIVAANHLSDAMLIELGQGATIATLSVILLLAPLLFVLSSQHLRRIGITLGLGALFVQAAMLPAGTYIPITRIWIAAFGVAAFHTQGFQQAIYVGEAGRKRLLRDFIDAACMTRNMLHATKNALLAFQQRPNGACDDPAAMRTGLQPWFEQLKSGFGRIARLEEPMLAIAGDLSPSTADTLRRDLPALLDRWTAAGRLLNQIRRNRSAPYLSARIDGLKQLLTASDEGLLALCDRILHQFELGEVVQGAVARFGDNGADLTISESLLWRSHLDADPEPLQHLITDAVANAIQASGEAPRIHIDVEESDPPHLHIWIRDDGPAGAADGVKRLADSRRDGDGRGCGMLNAVNVLKRVYDGDLEVREDTGGWGNSVGLRVRTAEHD